MKSEKFFKAVVKKYQKLKIYFSKKKTLLECSANYLGNFEYITCKSKLDQLYGEKANIIRVRSKCDWYEDGEKSTEVLSKS